MIITRLTVIQLITMITEDTVFCQLEQASIHTRLNKQVEANNKDSAPRASASKERTARHRANKSIHRRTV